MGLLKNCYATSTSSGAVEIAELALYDEAKQREVASVEYPDNPGFNDLLDELIVIDLDDDGLADPIRAENLVEIVTKYDATQHEEQQQTHTGNAPESLVELTAYYSDLKAKGLFVNGVIAIRPNDRLLRIKSGSGDVRIDYTFGGRDGLYCVEVRPGDTGTGIVTLVFRSRRNVSR